MINSGRDFLPSRRDADLKFRIALEGTSVSKSVAKGEIVHMEEMIPSISNDFRDVWENKFEVGYYGFQEMTGKVGENEKIREFVNQVAPEAVSMLMTANGKEWWKGVDALDVMYISDVAEKNYLRDKLADEIMGQLDWSSDGLPKLKMGHENRLRLLHTVLAYNDAKKQIRLSMHGLSSRLKFYDDGIKPDVVFDKMGVATERARSLFDWPEENHSPVAMNNELSEIFPKILGGADMLSEESKIRLMEKLGVVPTEEGGWRLRNAGKMSDARRSMYVVVNQRLRNKNIEANNARFKEVLSKDGPDLVEVKKFGMDEMILGLFANETAQDCGRYFQERVRREIINQRITEIRSLDEKRNVTTVRSERVFQGVTRIGAEIAYFVQDISNVMHGITNNLLERVKEGSFLEKVLGKVATGWHATAEIAKEVTDDIPSDFPDLARRKQRRTSLSMPDLFAEFEKEKSL